MIRYRYCLLVLMCSISASALADERALQSALAKAQMMLKQTSSEKLEAEKELGELKASFAQYKKTSENQMLEKEKGASRLSGTVSQLKDRYEGLQGKYQTLFQEYTQLVRSAREIDAKYTSEQQNFQLCFENNKKLFEVNQEILGNYQDKGLWEVLQQSEPFTGYQTVKLENLIQEYQYRNEDLKVDDTLAGATP